MPGSIVLKNKIHQKFAQIADTVKNDNVFRKSGKGLMHLFQDNVHDCIEDFLTGYGSFFL